MSSHDWDPFASHRRRIDPKIAKVFEAIDKNRSGILSRNELYHAMQNLNETQFSKETVVLLISLFDREGSGGLTVKQFAKFYHFMEDWTAAFEKYDVDKSGYIRHKEMIALLRDASIEIDSSVIRRLIFKLGKHGKMLNLDSFIRIATIIRRLSKSFEEKQNNGVIEKMDQKVFFDMALNSCF